MSTRYTSWASAITAFRFSKGRNREPLGLNATAHALGVSHMTVQRWEKGLAEPMHNTHTRNAVRAILAAAGIDIR
jgi:DNA-binding transcriptional regulator YiaG